MKLTKKSKITYAIEMRDDRFMNNMLASSDEESLLFRVRISFIDHNESAMKKIGVACLLQDDVLHL